MGEALGKMANLLNASLRNYEGADYGSRMYGSPTARPPRTTPDSNHYSSTLAAPAASGFGGTRDQSGWWHCRDHCEQQRLCRGNEPQMSKEWQGLRVRAEYLCCPTWLIDANGGMTNPSPRDLGLT